MESAVAVQANGAEWPLCCSINCVIRAMSCLTFRNEPRLIAPFERSALPL